MEEFFVAILIIIVLAFGAVMVDTHAQLLTASVDGP